MSRIKVQYGRWDEEHKCTACGKQCMTIKCTTGDVMFIETPHCPACGAKMDGGKDEQA